MPMNSLNELYAEQLVYLHDAERRLIDLLPELREASSSDVLERTFGDEERSAQQRCENIERILQRYGIRTHASAQQSKSAEALAEDIRAMIGREIDPAVKDAALVGFVQRFMHQEMAGYGTARAYAEQIGDDDGAELLNDCVEDEERVDKELTRLAEEEINPQAKTLPPEQTKLSQSESSQTEGADLTESDNMVGKGEMSGVSRQGALTQDEERPAGTAQREGTPSTRGSGGLSGPEDSERPRR